MENTKDLFWINLEQLYKLMKHLDKEGLELTNQIFYNQYLGNISDENNDNIFVKIRNDAIAYAVDTIAEDPEIKEYREILGQKD